MITPKNLLIAGTGLTSLGVGLLAPAGIPAGLLTLGILLLIVGVVNWANDDNWTDPGASHDHFRGL